MHAGEIDESSPVPLYHQVAASLRRRIADGEWTAAGYLPSVVDLGHDYSIGPGTIRRAMTVLINAGVVDQTRGQRARILPEPPAVRERVQLPPGAVLWAERATEEDRRRERLPRGAWVVVVHHKAVERRYPAERYEFQAPWRDPNGESDH